TRSLALNNIYRKFSQSPTSLCIIIYNKKKNVSYIIIKPEFISLFHFQKCKWIKIIDVAENLTIVVCPSYNINTTCTIKYIIIHCALFFKEKCQIPDNLITQHNIILIVLYYTLSLYYHKKEPRKLFYKTVLYNKYNHSKKKMIKIDVSKVRNNEPEQPSINLLIYYELIHTILCHVTSVIDVDLQINNIRLFLEKIFLFNISSALFLMCTFIYMLLCYYKNGKQTLIWKIELKKQLQATIPQQKYLMGWSFN
ncbi:hypothetical protein AGLY_002711, partial [Aphis glycines]